MRWLALLLLIIAPAAHAQFNNAMSSTTPVHTGSSYAGLGDIVASAVGYYGLRAYDAAVAAAGTQAAVNVRRASDSHTCDILVATTGGLGNTANCSTGGDNGQSLTSFLTSTSGFVTEVYNQSGGAGCNLAQSTAANQPKMSLSPLGIQFDSTPRYLACAMTAVTVPVSYEGAFEPTGTSDANHTAFIFQHMLNNSSSITGLYLLWEDTAAGTNANKMQANGGTGGSFGTGSLTGTLATSNIGAVAAVFASTTSRTAYLTATAGTSDTSSINPTTQSELDMGALYRGTSGTSRYLTGYIFEFGYWNATLTSGNVTSMCHQQFGYGWSTASC